MPQMSPLSWTILFLMLFYFLTNNFSNMKTFQKENKKQLKILPKENMMKW